MEEKKIITIDGPAGSGKSTVSKALARRLDYTYLDTGALYRALAYKSIKSSISANDEHALAVMCSKTDVTLENINGKMHVYVDGEDVGKKIRTEEVGLAASTISAYPAVRKRLLNLQREAGAKGGVIAEGRDMGSVVFPKADFKFYLNADLEERTHRRQKELAGKSGAPEFGTVRNDMILRDKQDSQRKIAPLKAPDDAIVIDSTPMTVEEVVNKIVSYMSANID